MKFSDIIKKFTIIHNLFLSFKKGQDGYSGRKLSAFAGVMLVSYMIWKDKIPPLYRINAFYALLMFSLLCLGLVTIPELIKVISFNKSKSKTESDENK